MRTSTAIIAIVVGAFALGTLPAAAGEDQPKVTQTEKSAPQRVRPHSHTQEKTGVPQPQPAADRKPDRPNPGTDYSRHFHPRDR
jgi:hypothetical protein